MIAIDLALADLCVTAEHGLDYFRAHGLDARAIEPATGGVFISPIRIVPPRFFEPDPEGKPAAWCEVRDDFGSVVDVAAWSMRKPDKVVTLLGRAAVLGAEWAGDPASYLDGSPLRVFRTPLAWLQARCEGVAVLDMARAARFLLDTPTARIAAEDDAHAREIMKAKRALWDAQAVVVPVRNRQPLREAA